MEKKNFEDKSGDSADHSKHFLRPAAPAASYQIPNAFTTGFNWQFGNTHPWLSSSQAPFSANPFFNPWAQTLPVQPNWASVQPVSINHPAASPAQQLLDGLSRLEKVVDNVISTPNGEGDLNITLAVIPSAVKPAGPPKSVRSTTAKEPSSSSKNGKEDTEFSKEPNLDALCFYLANGRHLPGLDRNKAIVVRRQISKNKYRLSATGSVEYRESSEGAIWVQYLRPEERISVLTDLHE
ncbi:hypothetical protein BV898_19791 [Hypsibius exemplaris]|uniref:Uncharacterized protein n=1 Tax=Hypsibius exemplaris TaxID=2072580 RepID=A0A9X6NJW8_HYPEX|nr:hypothetical protein BV898_19791 [Hypsibius exemplaris]